jgi:hypothetical protein
MAMLKSSNAAGDSSGLIGFSLHTDSGRVGGMCINLQLSDAAVRTASDRLQIG